jgi:hypothetical protein
MAAAIKRLSARYSKMPPVIAKISYTRHAAPVYPERRTACAADQAKGGSASPPVRACAGLLVAILKKRPHLDASLYTILQILSLTLFEKMPISQALSQLPLPSQSTDQQNHQCLLDF